MGDGADDHADTFAMGDYDEDDGDGTEEWRTTYAHGRRAPVTLPSVNVGRVRVLHETEKGLCISRLDGQPAGWLPKKQSDVTSQVKKKGDEGDFFCINPIPGGDYQYTATDAERASTNWSHA